MKKLVSVITFLFVIGFLGTGSIDAQCKTGGFYSPKSACYRTRTVVVTKYVNNPDNVARADANKALLKTDELEKNKLGKDEFNAYATNQAYRDAGQDNRITAGEQSHMWFWVLGILGLLAGIVALLANFANRGNQQQQLPYGYQPMQPVPVQPVPAQPLQLQQPQVQAQQNDYPVINQYFVGVEPVQPQGNQQQQPVQNQPMMLQTPIENLTQPVQFRMVPEIVVSTQPPVV